MMFGKADIDNGVLETRHTSYTLSEEINAKAARVFLTPALTGSVMVGLFALGCWDLLYPGEKWAALGFVLTSVLFGMTFARLVIVKSSLRGSELTVAGFGIYSNIRAKARGIVLASQQKLVADYAPDSATRTIGAGE